MKLAQDTNVLLVAVGLTALGVLLFGTSLNDPFHFDDALILKDSNVTNPARGFHFLNPMHLRQVTFFTFYLNYVAGGANPAGYHAVNVALHIANAVLLFLLLGRFLERWIAVASAAIFLAHPITTQAVLYVYQRSVLLACLFSLLALLALAEHKRWLAVLLFFLAFESKESSLAVPLSAASFYGIFGLARGSAGTIFSDRRFRIALIAGALALVAVALGLLLYWEERTVGIGASVEIGPVRYFLVQTRVLYTYLRLLVFPHPQSLEYEFPPAPGLLPLAGLVVLLVAGWQLNRRESTRIGGVCILLFLALLAPTSSFIPSRDPAFEHRLYLPLLAFALFAAWLFSRLPRRTWVMATMLAVLSVATIRRGAVWSSEILLWEDTVRQAPGKARAWFNLGGAYLDKDPDKARPALLRALELEPNLIEAIYNLGLIEQRKGNWNQALSYYEQVTTKDPTYWPAWNNLGNTFFSMGHGEVAIRYFEKTLSLNRDYWPAQYNVAVVHFQSGRYIEAVQRLKIVLDWRPDFRNARYLLAQSAARTGNQRAADEEMKKLGAITAAELRNTPPMILAPNRP